MATKKPAPKKAAKPAKKAVPVKKNAPAKKTSVSKPAPKKPASAKKPAKAVHKAVAKKPAPKKAASKTGAAKKPLAKKPISVKAAKPSPKPVAVKGAKSSPKPVAAKGAKPSPKPVATKGTKPAAVAPAKKAAPKPTPSKGAKPMPSAKGGAKPAPAPVAGKPKASGKKVPVISPETRFAETSKVTASAAEIRKALRAKEVKKDSKPVPMPKISAKTSRKYEPEFTKSVLDSKAVEEQTGPTQRYSDAELSEFRELVQNKINSAKQELAYLNGLITRKDSMSGEDSDSRYMTMEDGSLSMEREQLSQMASRQIDFIEKLEKALMRIENKTYGICRVSGKLIDKARLRAVPHATLSMEAKMGMNKPGVALNP